MPQELQKPQKRSRPPRIRVPNNERAIFTMDNQKFLGVIRRLSLTGGSAILSKGPISQGSLARMHLNTVFGRVTARIEFLRTGADGIPLAQAFRFLEMDDVSSKRFSAAVKEMQRAGFSDIEWKNAPLGDLASQGVAKLLGSIRLLSGMLDSGGIRAKR
jgi:hypothetical protein